MYLCLNTIPIYFIIRSFSFINIKEKSSFFYKKKILFLVYAFIVSRVLPIYVIHKLIIDCLFADLVNIFITIGNKIKIGCLNNNSYIYMYTVRVITVKLLIQYQILTISFFFNSYLVTTKNIKLTIFFNWKNYDVNDLLHTINLIPVAIFTTISCRINNIFN